MAKPQDFAINVFSWILVISSLTLLALNYGLKGFLGGVIVMSFLAIYGLVKVAAEEPSE